MTSFMKWQKEALTPCFVLLRRKGIHASTRSVPAVRRARTRRPRRKQLLFGLTAQDRDVAREARAPASCACGFSTISERGRVQTAVKILAFFDVTWNFRQAHKILIKVKKDRWAQIRNWVKLRRVAVYWQSLTTSHYEPPHGVP